MRSITVLKHKPNAEVVDVLKKALAEAEAGHIQGIVILGDGSSPGTNAPSAIERTGGVCDLSGIIYAFECWKFNQFSKLSK